MKIRPAAVLLSCVFALALSLRGAETEAVASPLHVEIRAQDPISFHQFRHGLADGEELILSTLRMNADQQAQFARYPGDVVVLGENETAPADAPVLRLTWAEGGDVTADLLMPPDRKAKFLGVLSRSPLSEHPDYKEMRRKIDQSGSSDRKRDATVRAQVQLELYLALLRAKRELRE